LEDSVKPGLAHFSTNRHYSAWTMQARARSASVLLDVASDLHSEPALGELKDLLMNSRVVYVAVLDYPSPANRKANVVPGS
jgi:hypothetical protein